MKKKYTCCALLLFCLSCRQDSVPVDSWYQWRGPNRDGRLAAMALETDWGETGPTILWRREAGPGFSGIIVGDSWLFTCFSDEENEYLVSLDPKTGELRWRTPLNKLFKEEFGDGPRATPAFDGTRVYGLGSLGHLHACDALSGKPIWHRNLHAEFGGGGIRRGYASSPLIVGNRLFVHVGPRKAVVCLDQRNGKPLWSVLKGRAGSSSPLAVEINGRQQIVSFIGAGLYGLNPDNGTVLWHEEWKTQNDLNIADPLFLEPDRIFVSSGYDKGAGLFQIGKEEKPTELWANRLFRNHFSSSITYQGQIFGFDNQLLKCLKAETGEEVWKARGYGKGTLVLVGDILLVLSEDGRLSILAATTEHRVLAEHQLFDGKSWTPPSFHAGVLYVRGGNEIIAVSLVPKTR